MLETWRWFGPNDPISLTDIAQAGPRGLVTALHQIPAGEEWRLQDILDRQALIAARSAHLAKPLHWEVVESMPVSEDIKRQTGDWKQHIETYKRSLSNLSEAGIKTICYNFMPLLDWTRTDLAYSLPNDATCMRFDLIDFVMFDLFVIARAGAEESFPQDIIDAARQRKTEVDDAYLERLSNNVICGLPGGSAAFTLEDVRDHLAHYAHCDHTMLSQYQADFLEQVAPHAQDLGMRLCCHPDDPPFSLLGLPRIMSTETDYQRMIDAVDIPANGITLCSGSLGARADNDLPGMMARFGPRVHFLHLRNVQREHDGVFGSFHEAEHLSGDTDMVALIAAVLREEKQRRESGREDANIPFRPDHGQAILNDLSGHSQPGYPAIGRLKGLAELRGVIAALEATAVL